MQIKLRCEELEKENSTLRHQKEMLQEYHQKQKSRADNLDIQRKSLQDSLAHLTENEVHMYIHTYLENIFLLISKTFCNYRLSISVYTKEEIRYTTKNIESSLSTTTGTCGCTEA